MSHAGGAGGVAPATFQMALTRRFPCVANVSGDRDRQEVKYRALYVIVHRKAVGNFRLMVEQTILYHVAAFL